MKLSTILSNEKLDESNAVGAFWPAHAKLRKLRAILDYPASVLLKPRIWAVIEAAIADKLSFKDLNALDEEIKLRLDIEPDEPEQKMNELD
jgi:hypothetical protein